MIPGVSDVVVATSTLPQDDVVEMAAMKFGARVFRGSEADVLRRFVGAVHPDSTHVIRLTGDCPFLDPVVMGEVLWLAKVSGASYVSNINPPTWPDGLDCEIFSIEALEEADRKTYRMVDRDTVTQYIYRNAHKFRSHTVICPVPWLANERWVLDTEDDYKFCQAVAEYISPGMSYLQILEVLDLHPELRLINQSGIRNERFYRALAEEELYDRADGKTRTIQHHRGTGS